MDRLGQELKRLNLLPEQRAAAHAPPGAGGASTTRAMLLGFTRAADWAYAAALLGEIQDALALPMPAVSISATGGYRLWFSLAEPITIEQACAFLSGLRRQYLGELPPGAVEFWPDAEAGDARLDLTALPPAADAESGKWSAFIEPSLGGMFVEEPGLAMAPNNDRQADLLAGVASIQAGDFRRVLALLVSDVGLVSPVPSPAEHFTDPVRFLLSVMNDPAVSVAYRIEAAKALLPCFHHLRPAAGADQSSVKPE